MELGLIMLGAGLVAAAAVLAFALTRTRSNANLRLDSVIAEQGKIAGQFQQTVAAQAALQQLVSDRLDALNTRLGESLADSATRTAASLSAIGERLTVIDEAQKNITALSDRVVSLQDILSDKQQRGAWGQDRMEDIVKDQLPPEMFEFQCRLSNNSAPDCVIRIPGMGAAIVIDAKFPLEAFEVLKTAGDDAARKAAMAQLRNDVQKHIADIARKYLIPGEVQSPALMFVPSESIYAELHDAFPDIIQRARRAQVVIVSPHILWLAVNTIRTLMRDAKMREQASRIQKEVGELLVDVKRLAERVGDLRKHFETTSKDIALIETSAGKIVSRGEKIEAVELSQPEQQAKIAGPA